MAMYINEETKKAILLYRELHAIVSTGGTLKGKQVTQYQQVQQEVYKAFCALADGLLNTNRLYVFEGDYENIKMDCVEHLLKKMGNYKPEVAAFPYFNMVARNFLIARHTKAKGVSAKAKKLEEDVASNQFDAFSFRRTPGITANTCMSKVHDEEIQQALRAKDNLLLLEEAIQHVMKQCTGTKSQTKLLVLQHLLELTKANVSLENKDEVSQAVLALTSVSNPNVSQLTISGALRQVRRLVSNKYKELHHDDAE